MMEMNQGKINVLVADDHAVVRSGLSMLINAEEDMHVVAAVKDGAEAFDQTMALKPDVVVMDLNMPPGENGLSATARIKEAMPNVKVLILTMHEDQEYLVQVL